MSTGRKSLDKLVREALAIQARPDRAAPTGQDPTSMAESMRDE